MIPWWARKPVFNASDRNVTGQGPTGPVDDRIERDGCGKPGCVADHPAGEHSTTASAGDIQILLVDVALFDDRIHS